MVIAQAESASATVVNATNVDDEVKLTALQRRRLQDRREWAAYWKIRDLESQGSPSQRFIYYFQRSWDIPATWFRERIVEPLRDKYRLPYYHRRINRGPSIDECGVSDLSCFFEANEQFRLDKMVDGQILGLLKHRVSRCMEYHDPRSEPCCQVVEDMEEAELNFFIKYGELGGRADVRDCYMKQKHRMIWERRHPEVMAERERACKEHKERLANGDFDMSFWKKGLIYMDKKRLEPPYEYFVSKAPIEGDKPLSKDWEYYKKVKQDPQFDVEQGKASNVPFV